MASTPSKIGIYKIIRHKFVNPPEIIEIRDTDALGLLISKAANTGIIIPDTIKNTNKALIQAHCMHVIYYKSGVIID